jgi:uncharacterized protein YbjT (DUF2867 family)
MSEGHAVRATTRDPERVDALGRLGVEPVLGDPDRVGTLVRALEHVSVAYILLGSATAGEADLTALHSTRLDMLLSKMLDSTVRGIVYEAAGTAGALLDAGAQRVATFAQDSRIPYAMLKTPPDDHQAWLEAALAAGEAVLAAR